MLQGVTLESEVVLLPDPAEIGQIIGNVGKLPDYEEKQDSDRKDDAAAKPEESLLCIVSQEDARQLVQDIPHTEASEEPTHNLANLALFLIVNGLVDF